MHLGYFALPPSIFSLAATSHTPCLLPRCSRQQQPAQGTFSLPPMAPPLLQGVASPSQRPAHPLPSAPSAPWTPAVPRVEASARPAAMAASPRRARVLLPGRPAPCPRRPGIPTASSPFPKLLLPWPILPCAQLLLAMCPTPLAAQLLHDAAPLFLQPRPLPRLPRCQRCARATCSTKCPSGVLRSEQHAVMPPGVRCFCAAPPSSSFTPVRPRRSLFVSTDIIFL